MSNASAHSAGSSRTGPSSSLIDQWSILPILAFVYVAMAGPLITFLSSGRTEASTESNLVNEVIWVVMAACAIGLAMSKQSRLSGLTWPPHFLWLFICLAFAGASILWAFKPLTTFIRFMQQVMIVSSVVLPAMLMPRGADLLRPLFICFMLGSILNALIGDHTIADGIDIGYSGFLAGKNALGQFAGLGFLLALYEMRQRGFRRALGVAGAALTAGLLFYSGSKTSTAFAFLAPLLATAMLTLRKSTRISSVVVLSVLTTLCVHFRDSLAWYVFHDITFTGRTAIWEFVGYEIDRHPLLGWGYQSFWLVGPDGPSVIDGPGWVKGMPHAHNGYLDTILQLGPAGLACLVMLIVMTVRAIERFASRAPARAWVLLSMVTFIIFNNFLESSWMHNTDFVWVVFLIIVADVGRCWLLYPAASAAHRVRPSGPVRPGNPAGRPSAKTVAFQQRADATR
jgi:exopolysaccharide production protein ExoQ